MSTLALIVDQVNATSTAIPDPDVLTYMAFAAAAIVIAAAVDVVRSAVKLLIRAFRVATLLFTVGGFFVVAGLLITTVSR
jgi:hypothetical protein